MTMHVDANAVRRCRLTALVASWAAAQAENRAACEHHADAIHEAQKLWPPRPAVTEGPEYKRWIDQCAAIEAAHDCDRLGEIENATTKAEMEALKEIMLTPATRLDQAAVKVLTIGSYLWELEGSTHDEWFMGDLRSALRELARLAAA